MFSVRQRYRVQFSSRRLFAALIAITGLSIFTTQVETNTNDPSQASTEVHWPAGYSPRTADIYSHNEVVIHASPSTVWLRLIAVEQWPTWCSISSEKVLGPHSKFRWITVGVPLETTVAKYVPNERLEYYSDHTDSSGIHAYRAWLLIPVADGCKVISELVELGPIGAYTVTVRQRMQSQLNQLKAVLSRIETRAHLHVSQCGNGKCDGLRI